MTELSISGMTCDHCQRAVKSVLESVEGVQSASVDLDAGEAQVVGEADLNALVAAVEEEGYQATPVSR